MKTNKPQQLVTLYRNLGGDPEEHSSPAKTITKQVYDPVTEDPMERFIREHVLPSLAALTVPASLASLFTFIGPYSDLYRGCILWEARDLEVPEKVSATIDRLPNWYRAPLPLTAERILWISQTDLAFLTLGRDGLHLRQFLQLRDFQHARNHFR